ncbi:hypothetical protein G9A89_021550 [Geosiphon pyriformis]|nr:hypothetical protein G9A89_021550 [Geosiphon pyriformis]
MEISSCILRRHKYASDQALGAVLSQKRPDGKEDPVAYASKNLNPAEKNYGTPVLEHLAIYWTVIKWREYLSQKRNPDQPIRVITESEKETILFNMHSDLTAEHFHKEATMKRTRKRYYWPSMYPDII